MGKSYLYAGNAVSQPTVAAGTVVAFPNIVRRYGKNATISGGNAVVQGSGYYSGAVNLTIGGTATGTAVAQVHVDGVAIPFAKASISTADGSVNALAIPFAVRHTCDCVESTVTVVVSGVITNVTNAAIEVEKL